jgi:CDP-diacylglycerol--glycerol-3-phosphate 3-phosphatidyltransferase
MISIYTIKPKFQQLLKPALTRLHNNGVTANQITIASIIISLCIGIAFWYADVYPILFLALPVGLLIRMALNALDGMMARTYNQQSKKGEVLNEAGDIISDLFIYFPLLKFEHANLYLIVVFLFLGILNEFAGLLAKVVSGQRRYDGPMGKSDRAFVISIYGLLAFFNVHFQQYTVWIFAIINLLLVVSTCTRLKKSLQ